MGERNPVATDSNDHGAAVVPGERPWAARLIATAIACCLLLQLHLVFAQPINWDEFRFLADVHSYARGELTAALLTFQVHLFGWLIGLGNEIDQIRAARLVMLALETGTLFLIWAISRKWFDKIAALLSVLAYVSFSFVLQHGASFRFDPIATFLVMASVALLLSERLRWTEMAIAGFAIALATIVTVKVVLSMPLVIAVATYRLCLAQQRRLVFLRLLFAALASALFLAILYAWHLNTLAGATNGAAQEHLAASYSKTLADTPFFPRFQYFVRAVYENPIHWVLLLLGVTTIIRGYGQDRSRALLLLAFLLPVFSIVAYRNAFPYFYAFILAPAAIFFAAAASRPELRRFAGLLALLLTGNALVHYQNALSSTANDQQHVVGAVHAMFPKPVPYIDRCSTIGSFPQAGLFMSSWWIENYVAAGRPIVRDLLSRSQPVFVLVNSPLLKDALTGPPEARKRWQLLEEDRQLLRSNYVHYWGPIWIAGKRLVVGEAGGTAEFLVGGRYQFEGKVPISVDGRPVSPGATVFIDRGTHNIASASGSQRIVLRHQTSRHDPNSSAPDELTFGRF